MRRMEPMAPRLSGPLDLADLAYEHWGHVMRTLDSGSICACGATLETYATGGCRDGGKCEGFQTIAKTVDARAAQ